MRNNLLHHPQDFFSVKPEEATPVLSRSTSNDGCMKKVVMEEAVVFDTAMKCTHVQEESCYKKLVTKFKATEVRAYF